MDNRYGYNWMTEQHGFFSGGRWMSYGNPHEDTRSSEELREDRRNEERCYRLRESAERHHRECEEIRERNKRW